MCRVWRPAVVLFFLDLVMLLAVFFTFAPITKRLQEICNLSVKCDLGVVCWCCHGQIFKSQKYFSYVLGGVTLRHLGRSRGFLQEGWWGSRKSALISFTEIIKKRTATSRHCILVLVREQKLASTISMARFGQTKQCLPGIKGQFSSPFTCFCKVRLTLIVGILEDVPLLCKKIIDKNIGLLLMRCNKS